jgi:uncharacterized iron-regulated membrane protein
LVEGQENFLMMAAISRLVLRYHRWLGLVAALPVIFWGLSGLSHPIMTRLQPQPAAMTAPAELLAITEAQRAHLPALSLLLSAQGMAELQEARLLVWQGKPVWQLTLPGQAQRVYVDAQDGQGIEGLDKELAVLLARHYAGEKTRAISHVELVTAFTPEYQYINRLLPVWRVQFAGGDHLRAYVETSPLRLATLDNDGKALFGKIFPSLHSWAFIPYEGLRDVLMSFFLALAFAGSVGGLWLYGFFWRKPPSGKRASAPRRWHRRLGVITALSTMTFTGSAILHLLLLDKGSNDVPPLRAAAPAIAVSTLSAAPSALSLPPGFTLQLLSLPTGPAWRAAPASMAMVGKKADKGMPEDEHAHHHGMPLPAKKPFAEPYFSALDGRLIAEGAQTHARALASAFSGLPEAKISDVQMVKNFEGEYGFLNKRLPVWKVAFATPDHLAVYVETGTGIKAADVRDVDRFEGFSFAYLHKGHWLDGLGKNTRDFLLGLFALLNVLVVVLGLSVWWRRRRA